MRIPKVLQSSMVLMLLAVSCSLMAVAQQYEIQSADYGHGNQRADVTQRVRDLAGRNATFIANNNTLGTDPAQGHKKSLRIMARGPQGESRTFEYREGSTVDGSQFSGWHGQGGYAGGDAGGYAILHAEYGTEQHHIDVTNRLRDLARTDRTFRMGNSTFGDDPDPGRVKALRIYARGPDGQERMFEYRENSMVDGSQFTSWGSGNWGNERWNGEWNRGQGGYAGGDAGAYAILHAEYGTEQSHIDVTNRLRELARTDRTFRMGNSTFGDDPDPGRVKALRIYARGPDGQERMFEYRENSMVDGSQFTSWGSGNWGNERWNGEWNRGQGGDAGAYAILHAEYGTEQHHIDVTNRLRDLARTDRTFRMGNSTFGDDPDPGRVKALRIYARGPDGQERMFEYRENSMVDGSQFTSWGSGNWGNERWNGEWNRGRKYSDDR